MRRYTPLFLITFVVLVVLFAGNVYLAGYADKDTKDNMKEISIYTTLPVEHAAVLAQEYEKDHKVRVNFIPLSEKELLSRVRERKDRENNDADAVLTNKETLIQAAKEGAFQAYTSEQTDIVANRFKDENGAWVGVWYDPIVFCANKDYLKSLSEIPSSWENLAKSTHARIGITDFYAADASANLLYTMIGEYDEQRTFDLLKKIHPQVVQYSKYLLTPVRMAGMGEVDIAVAVQSESIRYMNDGFPISLIYPSEGTAYMLTGIGVLRGAKQKPEVEQFIHWLLSDEVQLCLQKNRFFFVPTNQETIAFKSFSGKNMVLFENYSDLNQEQKAAVLDRWIKNIRMK